jgi:hypothetical protein
MIYWMIEMDMATLNKLERACDLKDLFKDLLPKRKRDTKYHYDKNRTPKNPMSEERKAKISQAQKERCAGFRKIDLYKDNGYDVDNEDCY